MTYGNTSRYAVMLGGMYHTGNLGTLAAEGIDWVWQHRPGELKEIMSADDCLRQNLTLQLG
jgi:hypothetical protein